MLTIQCPTCKAVFKRKKEREKKLPLVFCAYCGSALHPAIREEKRSAFQKLFSSISLASEKAPLKEAVETTIGHYQILKTIGKGGMGEVFLAYDTICGRKIALKRIRSDLLAHPQLECRFLREARITSQLTHPTIVPIYSIHGDDKLIYYTMPFVEGQTLRQILNQAKLAEKARQKIQNPHASIPALIRIFLQVVQACGYAHSQGVLHRDLKPENIIVGKYGQVLILDWGLAKIFDETEELFADTGQTSIPSLQKITKVGKVVGTIAYMAPERAFGGKATIQSDIYSLGVTLYQILTLKMPFYRKSLAHFKKGFKHERVTPPELVAPYRDVPQILSEVVKKCLAPDPKDRYSCIDELIQSLESYIEGRSEWFLVKALDVKKKEDWAFQENILIAEHTAITKALDVSDWVSLMISKDSFPDNARIEADICLGPKSHGIGFLFSQEEGFDPGRLAEGYCLWLASDKAVGAKTRLLRSSVAVLETHDIILKRETPYRLCIEKIDQHIFFFLNDILQFSSVSHIPVMGTHIGILAKDADFKLKNLTVSVGSQNITIGCLAVPDAFLASFDYDRALSEYRRIGTSFPGRAEGREALFRAGITLLEKAKATNDQALFDQVNNEFEKLRETPGAPLEYLGKALLYQTLKEPKEEIKCFELALRRYKRHPLIPILEEQIAFRMQESARENRYTAYEFISLVLRFLPQLAKTPMTKKLLESLESGWEKLKIFIQTASDEEKLFEKRIAIILAFWLANPFLLEEIISSLLEEALLPAPLIGDAIFAMMELGSEARAKANIEKIKELLSTRELKKLEPTLFPIETALFEPLDKALDILQKEGKTTDPSFAFLLRKAIDSEQIETILPHVENLIAKNDPQINALLIEAALYRPDLLDVEKVIAATQAADLTDEKSPLYFPYHCYMAKKEGKEKVIELFSKLLETPYPPSNLLGAHFLAGKINLEKGGWIDRSFLWERRKLYEQLSLFYHVMGDQEKKDGFWRLCKNEYQATVYVQGL